MLWPGAERLRGHPVTKGDVRIGNDVWIGEHVVILSGVTIGDGACVGAYSIVTKDIGPYEIWAGNPARLIRMRVSEEDRDFLLQLKWWEWPEDKVEQNIPLLMSGDIAALRAVA